MNNDLVIFEYPANCEANIYTHVVINENVRSHKHNYLECLYVLEGEATHLMNGKENTIKAGYFQFLNTNDTHSLKAISDNFFHRDILFKKEAFMKICESYSPTLFSNIEKGSIKLNGYLSYSDLAIIDRYCHILDTNPSKEEQDKIFGIIATTVINLMYQNIEKDNSSTPQWVFELIAILNTKENFALPLSALLKKFDYSHEHIMRLFKKHTGSTLVEYFNNKKLEEAYRLLRNTNLSIQEIIERIGISNEVHFYHIFKKKFGKTPKQIRI